MKIGGVAGVIFPISILQNGGLYREARLFLLRHFEIIALATFGPNAFMKTGIGTVTLFLRRRDSSTATAAGKTAGRIADGDPNSEDNALESEYAINVLGSDTEEYRTSLEFPDESELPTFKEHVVAFNVTGRAAALQRRREYRTATPEDRQEMLHRELRSFVARRERERVECFALVSGREVLAVIPPPSKKDEEQFLGYRFSDRRGREGMMYLSGGEHLETPLFDPLDRANPEKIATAIRAAFETGQVSIPASVASFCQRLSPAELIDFDQVPFEIAIRNRPPVTPQPFAVPSEKLTVLCDVNIGGTPATNRPLYYRDGKHLWVAISDMQGQVITATSKRITDEAVANSNVKLVEAGTTLISFKLSVGKTARAGADLYTNEAIAALVPKEEWKHRVSQDYLFALFTLFGKRLMNLGDLGGKQLGMVMNKKMLGSLRIPLLDDAKTEAFTRVFKQRESDAAAVKVLEPMLWRFEEVD